MKTIYWLDGPWPGRLAIVARPRGDEWLTDEIGQWRHRGIDVVVSLLTPRESRELGLGQEAVISAQQGIEFIPFPIPDRDVPASLDAMQNLVAKVTAWLMQGKNVAIHCRQGIGRSALLAASLLVSAGVEVEHAFQQIEAARGVAVPDTPEQRQWVVQFARWILVPARS